MEDIIPSNQAMKEEAVLDEIPPHVLEMIKRKKELEAELKQLSDDLKPHLSAIQEVMTDIDLEELDIGDYTIQNSKPYSYVRFKGYNTVIRNHPELLENYPDIVSEVNVSGHIKIKTND